MSAKFGFSINLLNLFNTLFTSVCIPLLIALTLAKEETTVDCLIDPDTRRWNNDMMEGMFIPQEAAAIKKIPLSRTVRYSILVFVSRWGLYLQIGYRFLKEEESPKVQTEPPDHETDLWKGIWALNLKGI